MKRLREYIGIRIRPIDNAARVWWRLWSVRLGSAGLALASVLLASPDACIAVWNGLPNEFKVFIPSRYMPYAGIFLAVIGVLARLVKQEKLPRDNNDGTH